MPKPRAGKKGRFTVGGTRLAMKELNIDYHGDDLDTTSFESNGKDAGTIGILGCGVDGKGDWDAGQNPLDDPPGIYPRDDLPNVQAILNSQDAQAWNFPLLRVLSAKNAIPVRGLVGFDFSGKSNGDFTPPQGSA